MTVAAAGTAVGLLSPTAHAATATPATATATFTPTGVLSIAVTPISNSTVTSLGSQVTGATGPLPLNPVVITDSMADSQDWTASVAASDCFPPSSAPTKLNTASATLPATALTFYPQGTGSSTTVAPTAPLSTSPASATLGSAGAFSAPSSPGSLSSPAFGSPMTVASTNVASTQPAGWTAGTAWSDPLANDGTYTVNPTLALNLSGSVTAPYLYTCTLQYTLVG